MTSKVKIPQTKEEARSYQGPRYLVIIGGLLGLVTLFPTHPWHWLGIGAVLVPWVFIQTEISHRKMKKAVGMETKEEWRAYVDTLPSAKQIKERQTRTTRHSQTQAKSIVQHAAPQQLATYAAPTNPPELSLPPYRLIGAGKYANYEVVGEAYRPKQLSHALGGVQVDVEKILEDVPSFLIPEPQNPHDRCAVMVWMNGYHVGYLERADAKRFQPILKRIIDTGHLPETTGRLWGVARRSWDGTDIREHYAARVALNEPELLLPSNDPPRVPYSLLPWGGAIQVTKEADFLPELTEHLQGPESYAIATLELQVRMLRNGNEREFLTVHIDGDQIGELTPLSSERLIPLVKHLRDQDLATAVWALVKGSPVAIEVTLRTPKAHEIDHAWFDNLPLTTPAIHRLSESTSDLNSAEVAKVKAREENWDF